MNENSILNEKHGEPQDLEDTVEAYEHVVDLSRQELYDAWEIIHAHEAVENLSRDELIHAMEEVRAVRHSSKAQSAFFSNISHEIRTPLTLLIAPLESMLQGEIGEVSEEQRSYLQLIYDNSQRLLKMVNDLLDFSKLEAGKMKLFYQQQDLRALVVAVLDTFQPFAEKSGIRFEVDMPDHELSVFFDVEKIEKTIINLAFNAFKFVSDGGLVRVEVKERKRDVQFQVFNSCDGLPADQLARAFDRYAQFENRGSGKPVPGGTGLGLALAKEFVELHKGTITMHSEQGVGVTCAFTLPRGAEHIDKDLLAMGWGELERRRDDHGDLTRPLPTQGVSSLYKEITDFYALKQTELAKFEQVIKTGSAAPLYGAEKRKLVLVVEDNPEMRGFLRYVLGRYFEIVDAADGTEGYKKALAFKPDLVISDIMMPGMNGYELTRLLKGNESTCRIPIILLTARANNLNAMIEGLNIGADDYVSKPFNIKELIARANALLRMESLYSQLENAEGVIFSLANAVEAKDSYTEGHCFRLAELSTEIARRLALDEATVRRIRHGAILHDVGKIGVPEQVLTKPGRLTDEERSVIAQHPVIGEKICRPLKSTSNILPIIRSHHERWDGGGYPDGLAGEAIPLEARIVALSDAFDAMVYDRVYRSGMGIEKARGIIRAERDAGQWDPRVVDAFLSIEEAWLSGNMF